MKRSARSNQRLSFKDKLFRLKARFRDPEWRRYGKLLLLGKVLGVGLTLFAMIGVPALMRKAPKAIFNTAQAADDPKVPDAKASDAKSPDAKAADTKTAPAPATPATPATPPDPYTTVKPGDIVNPINTVWTLRRRVSRVRHAGRLHDAGGGLLPLA